MTRRRQRPAPVVIGLAVVLSAAAVFMLVRDPDPVKLSSLDPSEFQEYEVGGIPRAVVTTSDGVWIARADQSVLKIDPRDGTKLAKVRVPFLPGQMVSAGGLVWVGAIEGTTIAALDPETAKVVHEVEVGTTPQSLATDLESLYVAAFDEGLVKRLDPTTGEVLEEVYADDDAFPSAVVAAFDELWISDVVGDLVTRVDGDAGRREVVVGDSPTRMVAGEGSIWVANFNSRSVSRIVPDAEDPASEILVGAKPGALTSAAGYIWVLRPSSNTLVLIDADVGRWTGEVYPIAEAPQDIAYGHDAVWIVSQDGILTRVPS